jgi:hypothetical protein
MARRRQSHPLPPKNVYVAECFLCGLPQPHAAHEDNVPFIPEWGVSICLECRQKNHDGILPEVHPRLVPYLKSIGVKVRFNANGWIDLPAR